MVPYTPKIKTRDPQVSSRAGKEGPQGPEQEARAGAEGGLGTLGGVSTVSLGCNSALGGRPGFKSLRCER